METEKNKISDQAANFISSMAKWAKDDKFTKISDELFNARKSICEACEHWDKDGFAGYGKCKKCGCSVAKLYIPSSICPENPPKWGMTESSKS